MVCFHCAWHQLTLVLIVFPLVCLQSLQFKSVEANLNIRWWSALCRLPILDTLPRKNILAGVDCDGSPSPWAGCGHMGCWVWMTPPDMMVTLLERLVGVAASSTRTGPGPSTFQLEEVDVMGMMTMHQSHPGSPSKDLATRVALLSVWPSIPILLAEGVLGSYPGQKVDA